MKKFEAMDRWEALEPNQSILEKMTPITYKSKGSKYGACGIRIDGNPYFIDAVLSNLKELLAGENGATRLQVSIHHVKPTMGKTWSNAETNAQCAYIRIFERGSHARILNAKTAE